MRKRTAKKIVYITAVLLALLVSAIMPIDDTQKEKESIAAYVSSQAVVVLTPQ